ncbi:MAG: hypothetical protein ACRD6N_01175, partial [Pyrinomonadaceae bacterium]
KESTTATNQLEKTVEQRERETANTVKIWVAEWEERKRALHAAAFSLVRSLENGSQNSPRRFAVTNG